MSRWRYACPECESRAVQQLTSGARPENATYPVGGEGAAAAKADSQAAFRCRNCGERMQTVIDLVRGCRVQQDSI